MSNLAQVFSCIHGEKKQLFLEASQDVSMRELFQSWSCGMRRQKQLVLANLTWHYRQKNFTLCFSRDRVLPTPSVSGKF